MTQVTLVVHDTDGFKTPIECESMKYACELFRSLVDTRDVVGLELFEKYLEDKKPILIWEWLSGKPRPLSP